MKNWGCYQLLGVFAPCRRAGDLKTAPARRTNRPLSHATVRPKSADGVQVTARKLFFFQSVNLSDGPALDSRSFVNRIIFREQYIIRNAFTVNIYYEIEWDNGLVATMDLCLFLEFIKITSSLFILFYNYFVISPSWCVDFRECVLH